MSVTQRAQGQEKGGSESAKGPDMASKPQVLPSTKGITITISGVESTTNIHQSTVETNDKVAISITIPGSKVYQSASTEKVSISTDEGIEFILPEIAGVVVTITSAPDATRPHVVSEIVLESHGAIIDETIVNVVGQPSTVVPPTSNILVLSPAQLNKMRIALLGIGAQFGVGLSAIEFSSLLPREYLWERRDDRASESSQQIPNTEYSYTLKQAYTSSFETFSPGSESIHALASDSQDGTTSDTSSGAEDSSHEGKIPSCPTGYKVKIPLEAWIANRFKEHMAMAEHLEKEKIKSVTPRSELH